MDPLPVPSPPSNPAGPLATKMVPGARTSALRSIDVSAAAPTGALGPVLAMTPATSAAQPTRPQSGERLAALRGAQ
jgi:hypothetical protein